ncbi:GTPase-activating protein, partial [Serendipita sp. 399]
MASTTETASVTEKPSHQISDVEKGGTTPDAKKNRFSFLSHGAANAAASKKPRDSLSDDGTNTTATKHNGKELAKDAIKEIDDAAAKQKQEFPPVPMFQLYRFHTKFEIILNFIGIFAAILSGAAQPMMTLLFGNLSNAFVDFGRSVAQTYGAGAPPTPQGIAAVADAADHFRKTAAKDALWLVLIGVGMFVATYTYMVIWVRTSEVATKRIRERYLQSILRQDVSFFDNVGAGEVATRIQTDTHLVQLGVSEKVPVAISFLGAFFTGFVLAFARSWKLALACSSIVPCIAITGGIMNAFMSKLKLATLGHIAEG